ncbi:Methyltransferase-like protein 8 [Tupaia chinensis]|uniref:Methyltransferase-like protein 8 n=1 Tax=Tupaia chinensis TaxID=246437 RepID=L9L9B3_TUPCH|nr:Methyltransferase-like protein 8 [Tupaia chinensis]
MAGPKRGASLTLVRARCRYSEPQGPDFSGGAQEELTQGTDRGKAEPAPPQRGDEGKKHPLPGLSLKLSGCGTCTERPARDVPAHPLRIQSPLPFKYENEASKYWDTFYKIHKNKFFKDRNWLLREFPEILPLDQKTKEKTGESSWDHMKTNAANCFSRMYCPPMTEGENHCKKSSDSSDGQSNTRPDFSNLHFEGHRKGPLKTELFPGSNAIFRILEVGCGAGNSVFPILNTLKAGQCSAFVHDVCDEGSPYPFPDGILDVVLLVFVLSAIHPDRMQGVINRLSKLLRPGGMLLFRDYGRYDKTQLRFKKEEIHSMFCKAGLDEKQNLVDRRLQVNRKKQVKMHRVWVQGKFQKPLH